MDAPTPVGRTRLGNPPNGDAPRPAGACRVLMIGDLIGKPGRQAIEQTLPGLRAERGIDFVTANGENVAGGMGLTASTAEALLTAGVDVITSGNHIWDKKDFVPLMDDLENLLRPANYPPGNPGHGWTVQQTASGIPVGVLNLQGQVFMANTDGKAIREAVVSRLLSFLRFVQ